MIRAEHTLHQEVMLDLRAHPPKCVMVPVPNDIWIPAHSKEEQKLIARLMARLRDEGYLLPGASDLLSLWGDGSGVIELKRPAGRSLFGKYPAGRPSAVQLEFQALCESHGVRHVYAHTVDEVRAALAEWGRLP